MRMTKMERQEARNGSTSEDTCPTNKGEGKVGSSLKRAWSRCSGFARSRLGSTLILWAGYVLTVECLALLITWDKHQMPGPGRKDRPEVQEKVDAVMQRDAALPALARWDSFWFYDVSQGGYTQALPEDSRWPTGTGMVEYRPMFFPLYPFAMRAVAETFSLAPFTAALWISRLALLLTLVMLSGYDIGGRHGRIAPGTIALLFFPSAFILVSPYAESLFLGLTVTAFVLMKRNHFVGATVAAFLAGLTRISGLALIPALIVLGFQKQRQNERWFLSYAPAIGVLAAFALLGAYFAWELGDPFAYLTAKKEWRVELSTPWATIDNGITRMEKAVDSYGIGAIYVFLEFPCLYLILISIALLAANRLWAEGVYVAAGALLTLVSGSLWGMPRFTLVMFPVFIVLGWLWRSSRASWHVYLLFAVLTQALVLLTFVAFQRPPP